MHSTTISNPPISQRTSALSVKLMTSGKTVNDTISQSWAKTRMNHKTLGCYTRIEYKGNRGSYAFTMEKRKNHPDC